MLRNLLWLIFAALLAASSPAAAGSLTLGVPDVGRPCFRHKRPSAAIASRGAVRRPF